MTGNKVLLTRTAFVGAALLVWEALARSGLFYRDVIPSLLDVAAALVSVVASADYYAHLGWTAMEIAAALGIGGVSGVAAGLILGANEFLRRAYEPYVYYLGATPKLVFFPVMIMWFGVGPSSKVALAAVACFFPIALATLAGVRELNRTFVKVGKSFRASAWQMATKIYLPALRGPIVTGLRLGFGLAVVVTLLAETKLSNQGLGFLVIQAFTIFDIPRMYALLITVFAIAIGANALFIRFAASSAGATQSSARA